MAMYNGNTNYHNYPEDEVPLNLNLPENIILSELINQHQIVPPIVEPAFAAPRNPRYFNYSRPPPPPQPDYSSVMYNITHFDPKILEQPREVVRSPERLPTFTPRPTFGGSYLDNVDDYLLSLELYLSTNNIPAGLVVDMIDSTLIGNAKRWFSQARFSIRDFQSFARIFKRQFNSTVEENPIPEPPKPPVNVDDPRICINVQERIEKLGLALYKFLEIQNGLRNPAELVKIAEDFNNGTLEYDTPTLFIENPSAGMPASLSVAQSESPTEQMMLPQAQSSPMEPKSKSNPNRRKQNKNHDNNLQQQPQQYLQQYPQQHLQQRLQQHQQQHPQQQQQYLQQQHHDQNQSQKPKKPKQRKQAHSHSK